MKWLYYLLANRSFLLLLLVVNVVGTIYGYYWYRFQLAETPAVFLAFVPDSPTASLFFVMVLFAFLLKRNWPLFEALAVITLFKYGIWAVVMNILVYAKTGVMEMAAVMLIVSHGAMAIQGLLYTPFYRIKVRHLLLAGIWTFHNDVIDYVFFDDAKISSARSIYTGDWLFYFLAKCNKCCRCLLFNAKTAIPEMELVLSR